MIESLRGVALFLGAVLALCVAPSLVAAESDDPLVAMIVDLLADPDKDIRALGFEQVRTAAPGEAATRQFAAQLPGLPADAKLGLLAALADRGDRIARTAVLQTLADSTGEVKVAAIAALGALGDATDVPLLALRLASGDANEQSAARASLVRLTGDGVNAAIVAHMAETPPPLHTALIGVLAERRAIDATAALLSDAVGREPEVRAAAMAALAQLGQREHVAGMVAGVLQAKAGKEREAAERAVAAVCLRNEGTDRYDALHSAFQELSEADRAALLSTLGRVGGAQAREIVEAAVANTDAEQHALGLQALCNWPDASVAPRLIELAQSDDHPVHRTAALRALIRVAPLADGRAESEKLALLQQAMAMCTRDEERHLVLTRASAIRTLETLEFAQTYLSQAPYAQQACETIVELAHHRTLREAHKVAFDRALDAVIETSQDPVTVDRAQRYKRGQTWVRPKPQ